MVILYPYFLLLLLVPVLIGLVKRSHFGKSAWEKVCDPDLLPALTIDTSAKESPFYTYLTVGLWCWACVCLSGPALLKKDLPTASTSSGIAVVVDMSPAMDKAAAGQMTRKLYDLLETYPDSTFGLVLTDAKAYTALPMTQDKTIFKNIIPDLKERIMPQQGQNIPAGIQRAEQLLKQSGFKKGNILLITAGVAESDPLAMDANKSDYPVYVLGVGEVAPHPVSLQGGGFWGGDTPIMASLEKLSSTLGKSYHYATLDESDLRALIGDVKADKIEHNQATLPQYQNIGIYGLLLLLPLTALLFRRGVLLALLLICFAGRPAFAGFWWRSEQELYQKQMQGIADFNIGQYDKAEKQFQSIASLDIEALYNQATALAYAGKLQDAIKTYEKVLQIDPAHSDAAYNLEYLKKQLPPPPEEQQQNADQNNQNQENSAEENANNADHKNADQNENQTGSAQPENESAGEQEQEQNQNATPQEQNTVSQSDNAAEQTKQNNSDNQQSLQSVAAMDKEQDLENSTDLTSGQVLSPAEQKQKELLDKVNPDAGRVLRYRLFKQYQEQL